MPKKKEQCEAEAGEFLSLEWTQRKIIRSECVNVVSSANLITFDNWWHWIERIPHAHREHRNFWLTFLTQPWFVCAFPRVARAWVPTGHLSDSETHQSAATWVVLGCCFYGRASASYGAGGAAETKTFLLGAKLSHVSASSWDAELQRGSTHHRDGSYNMWEDKFKAFAAVRAETRELEKQRARFAKRNEKRGGFSTEVWRMLSFVHLLVHKGSF